jgi:hypothetical protein
MKKVLLLLILTMTVVTLNTFAKSNVLTRSYLTKKIVFDTYKGDSIPVNKKTLDYLSGSLKGKILNKETGETIPGAAIYIPDLKKVTVSDINGNYSFESLPRTHLLVKISYLGFKTILENIDFATITTKDFLL